MSTRRRSNGEGSIFWNEARQRYEGFLDLGRGPDGKRRRKKVTGTDRRAVADKLAALRSQVDAGLPVSSAAMTVSELLERWLQTLPAKVAPSAVDTYRWAADRHLRPGLGAQRLVKLTPDEVEAFLASKAAEGMSRNSVVRLRAVLGQAIRWGEKRGYVSRNVASLADLPVGARQVKEGRALSVDEVSQLLAASEGTALHALWVTQLGLGLRPGEVTGLQWGDVDLESGVIHVRSALRWASGLPSLAEPKTARSRRSLGAPAVVIEALRSHRARQAEARLLIGPAWPERWMNIVFTTDAGTPLDPSNLRRELCRVAAVADLKGLRPYDLRHSAASLLAAAGVPLEHVADVLGHNGLRMARSVYVHALAPSVTAGVAPMDAVLKGTG